MYTIGQTWSRPVKVGSRLLNSLFVYLLWANFLIFYSTVQYSIETVDTTVDNSGH